MTRRVQQGKVVGAVALGAASLGVAISVGIGRDLLILTGIVVFLRMMQLAQRRIALRTVAPTRKPQGEARVVLWAIRVFPLEFGLFVQKRKAAELIVLAVAGAVMLVAIQRPTRNRVAAYDMMAVLGVACLAWLVQHTTRWELVFAVAFLALVYGIKRVDVDRSAVVAAVHDSLAIFIIASIVLYYGVGLRQPAAGIGRLSVVKGVFGVRPDLPLSSAVTTPPAVCAAYIAGLIAYRGFRRNWRGLFQGVAFVFCLFTLLATNGRTSIAFGMFVGIAALARPNVLRRLAPVLVVAALMAPVVVQGVSPSVTRVVETYVPFMHREGAGTAQTFGNRGPIWRGVLDGYYAESPTRQMIGWGATGQYTSGISRRYATFLGKYLRFPLFAPAHSTVLQLLLDSGLIGVVALLLAIWKGLRRFSREWLTTDGFERTSALAGIAMLTTVGCAGMTDALLAPGQNQETFWMLMLMLVAAAFAVRTPVAVEEQETVSVRS